MATTNEIVEIVKAEFDFEVSKQPLTWEGNKTPHYGLFRSDNKECVGFSPRKGYTPHTTQDVVTLVEAAADAFEGETRKVTCHFQDGHFVTVAPSIEHRRNLLEGGGSDTIWPRLNIRASYDARAFHASLGYFRDACSNMAMIRSVSDRQFCVNLHHDSDLPSHIEDLRITFSKLAQGWEEMVATAKRLEQTEVYLPDLLAKVYPDREDQTVRQTKRADERIRAIIRRIVRERETTGRPTFENGPERVSAWEFYNAVQGYTQHDKSRRGKPSDYARALLAAKDSHVAEALRLTMETLAA